MNYKELSEQIQQNLICVLDGLPQNVVDAACQAVVDTVKEPEQITLEISGFNTKAEAEEFISWYSGQGEQDASIWFECRKQEGKINVDTMNLDCIKTYHSTGSYKEPWHGNTLKAVVRPS